MILHQVLSGGSYFEWDAKVSEGRFREKNVQKTRDIPLGSTVFGMYDWFVAL